MSDINDVYSILSDESRGAIIKFTKDEQLAPLRNILEDILGKKSKNEEKNKVKRDKKLDAKDKKIQQQLEKLNKYTLGIFNIQKENTGGFFGKMLGFGNILAKAGKLLYQAGGMYLDAFKQQFKYLKQLSDAGVTLRDGYSETFALFSGMAKMSQENFAKMIIENSKFISNYNQFVKKTSASAEDIIANISSRLNGQYALDENQVKSLTTYFLDLTKYRTNQKLTQTDLITQTERLSIQFKALAKATGMSVENYIQLAKEQEKELYIRQITSDPRKAAKFSIMQEKFGTDAALWMETGIANEKVLQMMATSAGMQALHMARDTYNTAEIDENGLTDKGLEQIADGINNIVDGPLEILKDQLSQISAGQQYLGPEFHNGLFGILTQVTHTNKQALQSITKNNANKETSLINNMTKLTQSVDVIKELLIHKFMPKTEQAAKVLNAMSQGTDALQKAIWGKEYKDLKFVKYGTTRSEFKNDRDYTREAVKDHLFGNMIDRNEEKLIPYFTKGSYDAVHKRTLERVFNVAKNMQESGLDIEKINEQLRDYGGPEYQLKIENNKLVLDMKNFEKTVEEYMRQNKVSEEKIKSRMNVVSLSMKNAQDALLKESQQIENVQQQNNNKTNQPVLTEDQAADLKLIAQGMTTTAEQAKVANAQMKSENADNTRNKFHGFPGAVPIGY